jgi:glyoxylase-like metal-dependent hydrolase (beta-lactamase superfamily II)
VSVFLIDTPQPILIDSGCSYTAEIYADAIREITGGRDPELCLLTHTHFDHVGGVGYFRKVFPGMKTAGSAFAREITLKPHAVRHIAGLNEFAEKEDDGRFTDNPTQFHEFEIDRVLYDGDIVETGENLTLKVIETPGHSRDCLCFFIPEHKILFTGDSGGIRHFSGYVFYDFLSGCGPYMDSLKKLYSTGAEIICPSHYGIIQGKNAAEYFERLVPGCYEFIEKVSGILVEEGYDIERTVNRMKEIEYDVLEPPRQPEPAYLLNLRARVRSVAALVKDIAP